MDITYVGHSSFRIRSKLATIVTDPYPSNLGGLKYPKHVSADVVTVSHDHEDHAATSQIEGTPYIVRGPGEYEVKGVGIIGFSVFHDDQSGMKRGKNTIYRLDVDGISIVHLGDLGHKLSSEQLENLDGVDVLLIPVGGIYTIDAADAVQVIHDIEPSIVIPMHFGRSEFTDQAFKDLSPVSVFMTAMGKEGIPSQPKLTITKDKLPEELQVVVLS